jgi:hypothetical protein
LTGLIRHVGEVAHVIVCINRVGLGHAPTIGQPGVGAELSISRTNPFTKKLVWRRSNRWHTPCYWLPTDFLFVNNSRIGDVNIIQMIIPLKTL